MQAERILILLFSVAFFIVGLAASYYLDMRFPALTLGMHPSVDFALLAFGVFLFSILFFGYLSPVVLLIVGLTQGQVMAEHPLLVMLGFVPLLIASYVGGLTGRYVYLDLQGKANLFELRKRIVLSVAAALAIAVVFGFAVEAMPAASEINQYLLGQMSWLSEMLLGEV